MPVNVGIVRRLNRDTVLGGYLVPKGVSLFFFLSLQETIPYLPILQCQITSKNPRVVPDTNRICIIRDLSPALEHSRWVSSLSPPPVVAGGGAHDAHELPGVGFPPGASIPAGEVPPGVLPRPAAQLRLPALLLRYQDVYRTKDRLPGDLLPHHQGEF